jgi:aerobic carbon-monoxide dehydrogenase small subunit
MRELHPIAVTINGRHYEAQVEGRVHLADFLRHELKLTGTHVGCEHGVCGACTILVDGISVRSCLMLAVQANGREVVTIEGLATPDGAMHELQRVLGAFHGLQCGYCTPGILATLAEFLRENVGRHPTEAEVRKALSGNLCRCTGYQGIIDATLELLALQREKGPLMK